MNKEKAIKFAGLMEDYLNIPSFVCEMIQQQLEENKYKEVVEYVVQRRNEIESKPDFISDRNAITMLVNQNEQKDKEIDRLNKECDTYMKIATKRGNVINELEKMINDFDVFKEFTFPLMKRDEEQQVKSSIDYEWRKSIKEPFFDKLKELKGE